MNDPLRDKRIWLTGASTGIGRALALELAARGGRVAVTARNAGAIQGLVREIGDERALAAAGDISIRAENHRIVKCIAEAWGGVDIIILNAGTCEYVDASGFDAGIFERTFQVNFLGMVYGVEAALPLLRKSSAPQIVAVSSAVVFGAMPRAEAYGASKAAVTHMFDSLRMDLAPEGIRVTVVHPGFVRTPLTDRNDFPMPMIIRAERAAAIMARGIAKRSHSVEFPALFCLLYRLIGMMPGPLYARLVGGRVRRA